MTKLNPAHWTDDYLVFAKPDDKISLAIMRDCTDKDAAVKSYNRENSKGERATHAVRITTYEGTIAQLKAKGWKPPKGSSK